MQTTAYMRTHFQNDLLFVKCFVVFFWLIHLLFTICICQDTYKMSVIDFFWAHDPVAVHALGSQRRSHRRKHHRPLCLLRGANIPYNWGPICFHRSVGLRCVPPGCFAPVAYKSVRLDSIVLVGQTSSWLLRALFRFQLPASRSTTHHLLVPIFSQRLSAYSVNLLLCWPTDKCIDIWTAFLISMPGCRF
ncbi:hypothetical protein C8R43DRAFT_225352 [Mycena crocata]|nr:hypothetical protein C8R43DRAFT_225352 [Mycena crocata]